MGVRIGLIVLNMFAALWAYAALRVAGAGPVVSLLPVLVSLAIVALGWRRATLAPVRGPRVGRVVGIWTGIEFAALFVVANVLVNIHRPDLMLPLGAIIVGLHFIPLGHGIPVRLYYGTAAGLLVVGLIGLLLGDPLRSLVVGFGAAFVLWVTALAINRETALVEAARP